MTKVLFLATYGDFLATFELSNIHLWHDLGCEIHVASNFTNPLYNLKTVKLNQIDGIVKHEVQFARSPFEKQNFVAYRKLIKIIKEEHIDVIDCHNAVAGAFARIAGLQCGVSKIIYTPHSFFFYKGCPLKNRLFFKPVESVLARLTDVLITINKEDYAAAEKMHVRGKAVYIPGVGVDTKAIQRLPVQRTKYRQELGIPNDSLLLISVGELISRKNHETAIRAFAKAAVPNAYYIICGIGEKKQELQQLIDDLNMHDQVKLLNYRLDVKELLKACDVFALPSTQEGLPVALMEAMSAGLPCIVSNIRGNVDLIEQDKGGLLFQYDAVDEIADQMCILLKNESLREQYGAFNAMKIREYDITHVRDLMTRIYKEILKDLQRKR